MNRSLRTVITLAVMVIGVTVAFSHWNLAFRKVEVQASAAMVRVLVPHLRTETAGTTTFLVPRSGHFIAATLVPSCSALASVLALACLGLVTPRRNSTRARRAFALLVALVVATVGNLLRITLSMAAGAVAGEQALVLFHDVAGSLFTFASIILSYVLFLAILLPKEQPGSTRLEVDSHVLA
jgi:exosortase/archaeosortase family protein